MSLLSRQKKICLGTYTISNCKIQERGPMVTTFLKVNLWTKSSLTTVGYSFSENFCKFFHDKCVGLKDLWGFVWHYCVWTHLTY